MVYSLSIVAKKCAINSSNKMLQSPPKGSDEAGSWIGRWKRPLMVVFHAAVVVTYGIAIYVTNRPSGRPYDPVLGPYGRWRFLTYNNLVLQFVTYSVYLAANFVPSLTKYRDFLFTTLALPVGMFVVGTFWSVWHIAGRENILPVESGCPDWLNHVSHTIMAPINLVQLVLVQHNYLSDKLSIISLLTYLMAYNSYLLFIRFRTGQYVYIFMNKMSPVMIVVFIVCMFALAVALYKAGRLIHERVHKQENQLDRVQVIARAQYRPSEAANIEGRSGANGSNSNGLTLSIIENI